MVGNISVQAAFPSSGNPLMQLVLDLTERPEDNRRSVHAKLHSRFPVLCPYHGGTAFGAVLLQTGNAEAMRHSFSASRADAIPAPPLAETTASLALTASAYTSACSGSSTLGSCSVSSRHDTYLLFHHFR